VILGYSAGNTDVAPHPLFPYKMKGGGERWHEDQVMAVGLLDGMPINVAPWSHTTKGGHWQDALKHRVARTMGVENISDHNMAALAVSMGNFIAECLPEVELQFTAMWDKEAFLRVLETRKGYTRSRKDELIRAFDAARETGRVSKWVKTFIKREFYPSDKPPRAINARSDSFKALTMANWQDLGHFIFHNVRNFTKTVPEIDRPRFIQEKLGDYPVFFVTDYSRFESTFRAELMELEFMIYEHFGLPEWCYNSLSGTNTIFGETGTATIEAKRMSGEMNTSLGNSLMNFFFVYHIMSQRGLKYGIDWDGVFEGDDGLIGAKELPTKEEFYQIGCNIDIDPIPSLGRGGFCGLYYGDELSPVVSPQHALQALWSLTCPLNGGDRVRRELLNGKLLGLLFRAPGCPIICALQKKYMSGEFRIKRSYWGEILLRRFGMDLDGADYWMKGTVRADIIEPTTQQRLDYADIFNISLVEQVEVERSIARGDWRLFESVVGDYNPDALRASSYICRRSSVIK